MLASWSTRDLYAAPPTTANSAGTRVASVEWEQARRHVLVQELGTGVRRIVSGQSTGDQRFAWGPANRLLVLDRADSSRGIWEVNTETGDRRLLSTYLDGVRDVAWSAAPGARPVVARSSPTGTRVERLTSNGSFEPFVTLPVDVERIAMAPNDTGLAFMTRGDTARVYAMPRGPATSRRLGRALRTGWPSRLTWSHDGTAVLLSAWGGTDTVMRAWQLPLDGREPIPLASGEGDVLGLTASALGVLITVYTPRPLIGVLTPLPGTEVGITPFAGARGILPTWAPDGGLTWTGGSWDRLRFPHTLDVYVAPRVRPDALGPPRLAVQSDREDYTAEWSPDGRWIATHSHLHGADDLFLLPADSTPHALRRLSDFGDGAEGGGADWHPSGRRVVFGAAPGGGAARLFEVGIAPTRGVRTGPPRRLPILGFAGSALVARYSPDGSRLAVWGRDTVGRAVVFTLPSSGGAARVLARMESGESYSAPEWSRDGRTIYFVSSGRQAEFRLYEIPAAGGTPRVITPAGLSIMHPRRARASDELAVTQWAPPMQLLRIRP